MDCESWALKSVGWRMGWLDENLDLKALNLARPDLRSKFQGTVSEVASDLYERT